MGEGTAKNPYTREDVLKLIKENGDRTVGLDLSRKWFEEEIVLTKLDLSGIILEDAHLERAAHLVGTHLEKATLWGAHFEGAYLNDAHLEGADLMEAHLEGAHLMGAHLEGVSLWNTHLERADLMGAHLEGAKLWGAQLSSETRLENTHWGDYVLGDEKGRWFDRAADAYRRLKMWYTNAGMYDIAGKFFYREMEVKRKALKWWPKPWNKAWSKFLSLICGYGERPLRVIGWAALVVFGLAAVYYLFGGLNLPYSLYYSAVSFTALGYGNWASPPIGWVQGFGALESFVGVFTIALFLITFIRKMTR